jgi:hypothetical protein
MALVVASLTPEAQKSARKTGLDGVSPQAKIPIAPLGNPPYKPCGGEFSGRRINPMGKFLLNILAMIVAGVIVALIIRFFNV